MAKHEVEFNVPPRTLGRADVTFAVKRDGSVLGTLKVSNGSLVWFPKKTNYGFKLGWVEFAQLMQANAVREEKR